MTREEAIKDIRDNIKPVVGGISLDMAIKALEAEPCEDAISRHAANKIIFDEFEGWPTDEEVAQLKRLTKQFDDLPSVTPARPKGKWIPIKADCRGYTFTFECSECHGYSYEDTYTIECEYDWCPRCGSYNGGDNNGNVCFI